MLPDAPSLVAKLARGTQPAPDFLRAALAQMGRTALVSSFGADSAVLLHMLARIDRDFPVIFIDTQMLFAETLVYQRDLAQALGLRNIITTAPRALVPDDLHQRDPEACCALRKTAPLEEALSGYSGWITGRKRHQAATRADLARAEWEPETQRIRLNPLADWDRAEISAYMDTHALPRHPLVARGFPSIGCAPCTTRVAAHEDPRAGRWRGAEKTECGIHFIGGLAAPAQREDAA